MTYYSPFRIFNKVFMPIRIRRCDNKYQEAQIADFYSSVCRFNGRLYGSETGDSHLMRVNLIIFEALPLSPSVHIHYSGL